MIWADARVVRSEAKSDLRSNARLSNDPDPSDPVHVVANGHPRAETLDGVPEVGLERDLDAEALVLLDGLPLGTHREVFAVGTANADAGDLQRSGQGPTDVQVFVPLVLLLAAGKLCGLGKRKDRVALPVLNLFSSVVETSQ